MRTEYHLGGNYMNDALETIKDIRYVKLKFKVVMTEDTVLTKNKGSALRGGMGEMLLRANCIRDRDCEKCDFEKECIVQRTMYSKMDKRPSFMSEGDSVGYVLECYDHREQFVAGDELSFNLILFGKSIVYLSQYLNAFYALGRSGLGRNKSKFEVVEVQNSVGLPILDGTNVYMERYKVETLGNYINYRRKKLLENGNISGDDCGSFSIRFNNPLTVKYHGNFIKEFSVDAVVKALIRRLYILQCFEEIESDLIDWYPKTLPVMKDEEHYDVSIKRHSNRKKSDIVLKGIEGKMTIEKVSPVLLNLLLAGEITHIGKNTSFGFGGYIISTN
ncbi:MAG: CRISPR system precrRNA processing endoribonuclease RAMP protein Cas6 [Lachnospiraceae bacterium]|jgi:hypothetical protein|nr:CRISPR system precrRNA processing endoribonuclease RAMP protein Cas6 [Lachnospiraceae bacterium]